MNRPIHDFWIRVVGISFLATLAILDDDVIQQPLTSEGLASIGLNVVSIILIWHLNRAINIYGRYVVLDQLHPTYRLALTLLACMLATTLFSWSADLIRYSYSQGTFIGFRVGERPTVIRLGNHVFRFSPNGIDFFHANFIALFFVTVYELVFYRLDSSHYKAQLLQSEQEREKLRVTNMQSQLDALKQQVNPHFLFNSLNSLIALIRKNPRQAETFAEELSSVYRYILRANEQNLTDLTTELEFIHSYAHLLQTRYGEGFELTIQVDQRFGRYQLPPLTLQLLLENAVKHNVVLASKPLRVDIQTDELANLHIRNNLQQKKQGVISNGVGLANIMAKYETLGQAKPSVREEAGQFVVALPLIPV
ncbi:sensor protein lytS [Spirosoma sp. HMF4905]|uniref:Sensor protein lytS n=1 Tax=Spirosoma arboris TaxID=2682092 RepID=A0A7K1SJE3_9BACT|nr:sensor histidine kinase [Spirosoma arboris]MVM33848.1 sensor protein lytS [Spirosoma arboris]